MNDYRTVLDKSPQELLDWITKEFIESVEMPVQIIDSDGMNNASEQLLKLSSYYSYLATLLSEAKLNTRLTKRSSDKKAYEDAVDKKEIVQNAADAVKMMYAGVSRAVTIRTENLQELRMNASGRIYKNN